MEEIEFLKKENEKLSQQSRHWKDKYKKLMDEKVQIERSRNRLFECTEKLVKILENNGIQFNLDDYKDIKNQAGVSLFPGNGQISDLNYKPFGHVF